MRVRTARIYRQGAGVQCCDEVVGHVDGHVVTYPVYRKIIEWEEHAPEHEEHGRHQEGISRILECVVKVFFGNLGLLWWYSRNNKNTPAETVPLPLSLVSVSFCCIISLKQPTSSFNRHLSSSPIESIGDRGSHL